MSDFSKIITQKNVKQIWRRLLDSIVPIVGDDDLKEIKKYVDNITNELSENKYIPDVGHGYLGYPKSNGCTRFVPIISKEDMAVYYFIVLSLQKYLISPIEGVYGAWRVVPEKIKVAFEEAEEDSIIDPYYSETLSKKAWFKNWNQLNDLIEETCNDKDIGNYVITTDIENFYDTIDVGRLISNIRGDVTGESELISLLEHFLSYWDRRVKGYSPSTKGIPQEIISDASRILANYYLIIFDKKFKEYCNKEGMVYIRWADDIFIFGKSFKSLEFAVHHASRILLGIGLNLSAAKTKKYTRKEFKYFRCIPLIQTIKSNNAKAFSRELNKLMIYSRKNEVRLDTALKASLNIMSKNSKANTTVNRSYVEGMFENYEYLSTINESQYIKIYRIHKENVLDLFKRDLSRILSKPYAAPRAVFIKMVGKHSLELKKLGISTIVQRNAIARIKKEHANSPLIVGFCADPALCKIVS